jgi:hypothetical protein
MLEHHQKLSRRCLRRAGSRRFHYLAPSSGIHQGDDYIRLNKVLELMDIDNKFAYGKDTYHNKRTCSPEDDRSYHYNNQKRKPRNYEG